MKVATYQKLKGRGYKEGHLNIIQQVRWWSQELKRFIAQRDRYKRAADSADLASYEVLISRARSEVKRRTADLKAYNRMRGAR